MAAWRGKLKNGRHMQGRTDMTRDDLPPYSYFAPLVSHFPYCLIAGYARFRILSSPLLVLFGPSYFEDFECQNQTGLLQSFGERTNPPFGPVCHFAHHGVGELRVREC